MDQARRFARSSPACRPSRGYAFGLFVGGNAEPPVGMLMTPRASSPDRDTMRRHPPDILLTNYKMLDYLAHPPRDRQLWEHTARPPCAT